MINVTVWNEFRHEKESEEVRNIYPAGMHNTIKDFLQIDEELCVKTATLDEPEHGLSDDVLENTDVLLWWGHCSHGDVKDEIVEKIQKRVLRGMGIIVLHSGHHSKIFKKLMGTTCNLKWRENGEKERLHVVCPGHPIAKGLPESFVLEHSETYGEFFDIPKPDALVFIGWFQGGNVFRSGCCYNRGYGKVFYFQPGHESFPIFYDTNIQKIMTNAVKWAKPCNEIPELVCPHEATPLEKI